MIDPFHTLSAVPTVPVGARASAAAAALVAAAAAALVLLVVCAFPCAARVYLTASCRAHEVFQFATDDAARLFSFVDHLSTHHERRFDAPAGSWIYKTAAHKPPPPRRGPLARLFARRAPAQAAPPLALGADSAASAADAARAAAEAARAAPDNLLRETLRLAPWQVAALRAVLSAEQARCSGIAALFPGSWADASGAVCGRVPPNGVDARRPLAKKKAPGESPRGGGGEGGGGDPGGPLDPDGGHGHRWGAVRAAVRFAGESGHAAALRGGRVDAGAGADAVVAVDSEADEALARVKPPPPLPY